MGMRLWRWNTDGFSHRVKKVKQRWRSKTQTIFHRIYDDNGEKWVIVLEGSLSTVNLLYFIYFIYLVSS